MRKLGAIFGGNGLRGFFLRSVLSVRTRFSLFTAAFLLVGVGLCFCCGRIVLVHFQRNAETQVQRVGEDITQTVSQHAEFVRDQLLELFASYRLLWGDGGLRLDDVVEDRHDDKSGKTLNMKRPVLERADAVSDVAGGEVLVVDNDEAILKTTSILLTALKLVPHVAHDRREALALVRRRAKRLRVILLDAHLGGVDTVRLMNAFRIGAPNVPVIVISGSSPAEMAEMFKPHPYDAFLAKPFTMNELKLTISSLTPRKDA